MTLQRLTAIRLPKFFRMELLPRLTRLPNLDTIIIVGESVILTDFSSSIIHCHMLDEMYRLLDLFQESFSILPREQCPRPVMVWSWQGMQLQPNWKVIRRTKAIMRLCAGCYKASPPSLPWELQ